MAKNHQYPPKSPALLASPFKTHHREESPMIPISIKPINSQNINNNNNYNINKNTKKRSNKCVVYCFALFVLFCFALVVFASVVIRVKQPTLKLTSVSIKSLKYDNSPSFSLTLLMKISISNRNYGHLELHDQNNNMVHMFYAKDMIVVGDSKLKFNANRVLSRSEEHVGVEIKASSSYNGVLLASEDRDKLNQDMNSGVLELMGYATIKSEVHLLKNKILRPTVAVMNCTIGIDLRKQLVYKLQC